MTRISHEGFDHYGTNTAYMLQGPYADLQDGFGSQSIGVPSYGVASGLYSLFVVAFSHFPSRGPRRVLPGTRTSLLLACRFSMLNLPQASGPNGVGGIVATFYDNSNTEICYLAVDTTGSLSVYKSDFTVPIATTQGPIIKASNWHHIELQVTTGAAGACSFVVRVDSATGTDTPVINGTNLTFNTTTPIAQYRLGGTGGDVNGNGTWLDDVIISDTNGTVNNGFEGDQRVATLLPISSTAVDNWTPSYLHEFGAGILYNINGSGHGPVGYSAPWSTTTDLGAGDYTIETFIRFRTLPSGSTQATIMGKWDATNNRRSWQVVLCGPTLNNGNLIFQISTDGTAGTVVQKIAYPWVPLTDIWYHFAVVRASSQLLLFVNGQQLGVAISDSSTYYAGTEPLAVACQVEGTNTIIGNTDFQGYLDETRLTVGYARYTSTFTPPTAAFPRGSPADPQWSKVALLCGYDTGVVDESSFLRPLTPYHDTNFYTPTDGPSLGSWSTINKINGPGGISSAIDQGDDSFIYAAFLSATDVLTLTANPSAGDTVRVGTTNGSTPAVYTFRTTVSVAYDVLIGANISATLTNLLQAINLSGISGTTYGTGTLANNDVNAIALPSPQMEVSANIPGSVGNAIVATASITGGGAWATGTLAGGVDIPGPSEFVFQRPPPNTTVISAIDFVYRAEKSDAGAATMRSSLVSGVGGSLPANTYYYKITAITLAGETTASNERSIVLSGLNNAVELQWSVIPGATGYRVYRGTSAGGENGYYLSAAGTSNYLDIGASTTAGSPPGSNTAAIPAPVQSTPSTTTTGGTLGAATYYYKITALTANGETVGSNEQSQVTTGSTSTVTVNWATVAGATSYKIYRGTSAGGENLYYTAGSGAISFIDTGATGTSGTVPGANTATLPVPVQKPMFGPTGSSVDGATNPMTVSWDYYHDVYETDPSTSGPITPNTIINGRMRLTRVA